MSERTRFILEYEDAMELKNVLFWAMHSRDFMIDAWLDPRYLRDLYNRIHNYSLRRSDDGAWYADIPAGLSPRRPLECTEPPALAQQEIFDQRASD